MARTVRLVGRVDCDWNWNWNWGGRESRVGGVWWGGGSLIA